MRNVPQVAVARVDLRAAGGDRNAVRFRIIKAGLARVERPLAPRCNALELGRQRLVGVLKANLVIALAGASVGHGGCAFRERDFDLRLRNHRARNRGPQQVFAFIDRARLHRGHDVITHKLFTQVADDHLLRARVVGFGDNRINVLALAHVADHGNDIQAVILIEPRDNNRGVETT